uniref:Protein halfway n=1 Tax=Lygus hesperus TaxID=30085 RepID=A0A0A9Z1P9_LYGHE
MKIVVFLLVCLKLCSCCQPVSESDCPPSGLHCDCGRAKNLSDTVVCCNINTPYKYLQGLACGGVEKSTIKHLHIFNYTLEIFNASSSKWRHLETLSVTGSQFKMVDGQFKGDLKCVNFSSNSLISIYSDAFTNLSSLLTLDLSNNNLTQLPNFPSIQNKNLTLDISRNIQLQCQNIQDNLLTMEPFTNLHIDHENETFCAVAPKKLGWFNSTYAMPWSQMVMRRIVSVDCPSGPKYQCSCTLLGTEYVPNKPSAFSVQVDCAGRQLTELPKTLPPNTHILNVSNNSISSLEKLVNDSSYSNLKEFFADNNKIDNIKCLEGSTFLYGFRRFNLSGNRIKSIPTYLFSNVFDSRWDDKHVTLGGNPINCDCNTAQSLKMWLLSKRDYITDYADVFCDKEELGRVINLDMNKVCIYQKDWTDYIYYIIAGEILLLILLISKVSYDYWVFKTSGYLPWPASKMPKLPCDWVFET